MATQYVMFLLYLSLGGSLASVIQSINIIGNTLPQKGEKADIVCKVFEFQQAIVTLYKSTGQFRTYSNDALATCSVAAGCTTSSDKRYSFSTNTTGVYIHIDRVVRATDQAWWHCELNGQKKSFNLIIYTTPDNVQMFQSNYGSHDLSKDPVILTCRTPCIYPSADMSWYYLKTNGNQPLYPYTTQYTYDECHDMEKSQLFSIRLKPNTTLPDNSEQMVKFRCGIDSFPGLSKVIYSDYFEAFFFAVTVSTVTLKDEGYTVTPSDTIIAHNGSEKHLECRPGTSRPAPMIVWYMGVNVIQRSKSTTLSFLASVNHNNSIVSCRAYNLQPEQAAIASVAVKLVIKVRPSIPTNPTVSGATANSVKVTWTLGYDGGLQQTIHVQYKADKEDMTWKTEIITVSSEQNAAVLGALASGTLYQLRLFASNVIGPSEITSTTYFATSCNEQQGSNNYSITGVFIALLVVVAVCEAIYIFYLKYDGPYPQVFQRFRRGQPNTRSNNQAGRLPSRDEIGSPIAQSPTEVGDSDSGYEKAGNIRDSMPTHPPPRRSHQPLNMI